MREYVTGVENAGAENAGATKNGKPREKKRKVGPIIYQQLEQSMIGYCDNYCKDTKAVSE